ncbi:DEKNAAC101072 [Brettanomyces naardenensis]|uniref:DEKNAAC101073 n=1 Tax=Brettanomyces naardenensis TaxID=13370 RepID=A0A448YGY7_BRENA|nr:DEKNAAC101072 [Brettanomyces naardenensis]
MSKSKWPASETRAKIDEYFPAIVNEDSATVSTLLDDGYLDFLWGDFHGDESDQDKKSVLLRLHDHLHSLVYRVLKLLVSESDYRPQLLIFITQLILRTPDFPWIWEILAPSFSILIWTNVDCSHLVAGDDSLKKLLESRIMDYDESSGVAREELQLAKTWFYTIAMECTEQEALQLIITVLSYIPTRRFANTLLKEINFLSRLKSDDYWLKFFVNYPFDDITGVSVTYEVAKTKLQERFFRFISIAYDMGLQSFGTYRDLSKVVTNFDNFRSCFGDADQDTLTRLSERIHLHHSDDIIRDLWFGLGDFTDMYRPISSFPTDISKPFVPSAVPTTPSYIDMVDFFCRSSMSLKNDLSSLLSQFYSSTRQRLKVSTSDSVPTGTSKFVAALSHAPVFAEADSILQRPGFKVEVIADSEIWNLNEADLIYLVSFGKESDITIPATVISATGKRYLLMVEKKYCDSDSLSKTKYLLRLNGQILNVAKRYSKTIELSSSIEFDIPAWLLACFRGHGRRGSDISVFVTVDSLGVSKSLFLGGAKRSKGGKASLPKDMLLELMPGDELISSWKKAEYIHPTSESNLRLDNVQSKALLESLLPGLTVIDGVMNTGKTTIVQRLIHSINTEEETVLIVVGSQQAKRSIMAEFGDNMADLGKLSTQQDLYRDLLRDVQNLAVEMDVKGSYNSNYESALFFYTHHLSKKWDEYLQGLKNQGATTKNIAENYPFGEIEGINGLDPQTALKTVLSRYNRKIELFRRLEKLKYLDILHEGSHLESLSVSRYSRIMLATPEELLNAHVTIERIDNIVMLNAEGFSCVDLVHAGSLQGSLINLKRLVLLGNSKLAIPDSILFQLSFGDRYYKLNNQYRVRDTIMMLGKIEAPIKKSIKSANPGFSTALQFIDLDSTEECRSDQFENLIESEFVVCIYMYMRLLGYRCSDIGIVTEYKLQKVLIQEVVMAKCSEDKDIFGTDMPCVSTVDELHSSKYRYLLVSLVRTTGDANRLHLEQLCNSVTEGMYIVGSSKAFSFESSIRGKMRLVAGEMYTDNFKRIEGSPVEEYEMEGLEHFEKYVNQMLSQRRKHLKDS